MTAEGSYHRKQKSYKSSENLKSMVFTKWYLLNNKFSLTLDDVNTLVYLTLFQKSVRHKWVTTKFWEIFSSPLTKRAFGIYSHDIVVVILNLLTILKVTLTIGTISGKSCILRTIYILIFLFNKPFRNRYNIFDRTPQNKHLDLCCSITWIAQLYW